MELLRDAWVEVDLKKLSHNFLEVRRAVGPGVKICAVLKAQAYGMGGARTAQVLNDLGADAFAVATLSEAMEIRRIVPQKEILVLGHVPEGAYGTALLEGITLTMFRQEALLALDGQAAALGIPARVHIKVNTGMNRIGFAPTAEGADRVAAAFALPHVQVTGLFTHLAVADEKDPSVARMQAVRFDRFLKLLKERGVILPLVHMAASPSICNYPEYDRDMVRPGLMLTGHYASSDVNRERIHLQPCVKLKARLGNVMWVKANEGIGYGYSYRLEKDTPVGLLPLGFSDGFPRAFSNHFFVTIRTIPCPVIGSICMDHCMIDLSAVPDAKVGDEIVVYGDGTEGADGAYSPQQVADMRGTVVDEVLTNLSPRLPRMYVS